MSRSDNALCRWNIRRMAIAFGVIMLLSVISCLVATGIVFRSRVAFAMCLKDLSDGADSGDETVIRESAYDLSEASEDVVDVLILDSDNRVLFSANSSAYGSGVFTLSPDTDNDKYLSLLGEEAAAFRYVSKNWFMLESIFTIDIEQYQAEYDGNFYRAGFVDKEVYLLSYIGVKSTDEKIYILSRPTPVANGLFTLKIDAVVFALLLAGYWVLLALGVYQSAARAKLSPAFWGSVALITNVAGLIVYALYRRSGVTCPNCHAMQNDDDDFCSLCGTPLGRKCNACGAHVSERDIYCHGCGKKLQ